MKRGRPKGITKTRISFRICDTIKFNMEWILRQTGIKKVDYINEAILQYNEKMTELAKRQYKCNWNEEEETI